MTADVPSDGRLARSARTRTAVIDALLSLYEEGDLNPTAVRVAARAGVSLRTVYGHFTDLEQLYAEAGERELQRLLERTQTPDPSLPFDERLRLVAADRAAVLEWLLPIMRAAAAREASSEALAAQRRRFVEVGDAQVQLAFAPELARLAPEEARALLDEVHVVAGGFAWPSLRLDRGLDPAAAEVRLLALLEKVLAPLR